ncbi:MAG: M15 family metallopeptidase [Oscillospiraceae bacterium]|nr:M15 family metallopeptidase [Oscillospiraceae bacterium]
MKLKEKKKTLIAVLIALAAVVFVCAGLMLYQALSFKAELQSAAAALKLEADTADAAARAEVLSVEKALRRAQDEQELRLTELSTRAQEFRSSLLTLVNPWNEVPEDLDVSLATVDGYLVDRRCRRALYDMLSDCREQGYLPIICSAFRTMEYQDMLYNNKIKRLMAEGVPRADAPSIAAQSVAIPGTSEHQLGLAVDIISETYTNLDRYQEQTAVQQWIMQNCWRYGFILRYPNGTTDITGIIYEPWHYRYVGAVTAKAVHESGLVFEEYLESIEA